MVPGLSGMKKGTPLKPEAVPAAVSGVLQNEEPDQIATVRSGAWEG